jgi:hypothetical protein
MSRLNFRLEVQQIALEISISPNQAETRLNSCACEVYQCRLPIDTFAAEAACGLVATGPIANHQHLGATIFVHTWRGNGSRVGIEKGCSI